MLKINILRPTIFPPNITSGITFSNYKLFPNGFSAYKLAHNSDAEVMLNREILASNIGCDTSALVFQKQVHSNYIRIIGTEQQKLEESDGFISNNSGLALCINLADCAGILCYDPLTQCIAAFHSGWKGTVAQIVPKGIAMMREEYGAKPSNILVYITPCAGKEKYEVGEDVAKHFPNHRTAIGGGKYLLDLKGAIVAQLRDAGVDTEHNLEVSSVCTISNDNFHSFRRDGDNAGRMTAFILIK
ncbi:MAG: peptidoglycan editing factor PgeF [Ignavibacteria bacterium]|jgi:YfiH family protein|nr:peptidoglycan editing factor PgeF [Ignavibacteria bacterium]